MKLQFSLNIKIQNLIIVVCIVSITLSVLALLFNDPLVTEPDKVSIEWFESLYVFQIILSIFAIVLAIILITQVNKTPGVIGVFVISLILFIWALIINVNLLKQNDRYRGGGSFVSNHFIGANGSTTFFPICLAIGLIIIILPIVVWIGYVKSPHRKKIFFMFSIYSIAYSALILFMTHMVAVAAKPVIYLRTPRREVENIVVRVAGKVTKTAPEPKKTSKNTVIWENIVCYDNKITYKSQLPAPKGAGVND